MKKLAPLIALILILTACANADVTGGDVSSTPDTPPEGQITAPPLPPDLDGDTIALRIGDVELTSNEYRYHYYTVAQRIISFYGAFYGIDPNQPFEEQYIEEGTTWAEFFAEQAITGVRNTVILSEQAKKMGMTLDKSFEMQVTEQIENLKDYCEANGLILEQVLRQWYGGNLDEQKLRDIMTRTYLGYQFELYKRASIDVSDGVLLDFYNENTGDFDAMDYLSYMFDTAEEAEACLAAITDKQSFYDYIRANFDDDMDNYLVIGENNTGDEFADWLFDDVRVEGDVSIIEAYDLYFVVYFIKRYQPDDESLSIRHVLISTNEMSTDEARAKAEELYDVWKNGAATEETFAQMAINYSSCSSASNGGLLEDVQEGQMVPQFNDWCFDPARRLGDTGLVDTEFGTHIMYYTGHVLNWKSRVKQTIIENAYAEFYEALLEQYQVEELNMNVAI